MLRSHRLASLSLTTVLALSGAACGLPSLDSVFETSEGTAGGGNGGGGTGGGATTSTGGDGAGGGATTSTGGGGTGGGATTSTGSSSGAEDCTDGADNDGDGDVDCADGDCQPGFECVPAAPAGWEGHFHVNRTDYPTPPPACDSGADPAVFFGGPAGPAECTDCSCNLEGAACSPPTFTCWAGSTSCMGTATDWTPALADGQCHKPNLLGGSPALSCSITAPAQVAAKGTCSASGVDFPNKDPWAQEVGACELPGGKGCAAAEVCVPKGSGANPNALCIQKAGDLACPAGAYSEKALAFAGGTDNRSCSACTCGDAGTTCNGGSYTVFDPDQCGNNGNENPATIGSPSCQNVSSLLDFGTWSMQADLPEPQGACPPGGGAAQGQVDVQGPVTFCCQP
jgi:hypothetical protein